MQRFRQSQQLFSTGYYIVSAEHLVLTNRVVNGVKYDFSSTVTEETFKILTVITDV